MTTKPIIISASLLSLAVASPSVAQAPPAPAAGAADNAGLEDIVVTARRRDESAQTVPVAVTALSATALGARTVVDLQDLSSVVSGFRFGSEGGKTDTNVTLRGLSRIPLGEGVPAVVVYFANVPLAGTGSNIPTFDIGNVQVLKGPQGTLFGRNTLGGAVVVTPTAPDYEIGGYARGRYGNYDDRLIEGAINLPIVADKVAVRVAGQIRRRDPLTNNLSGGDAVYDNTHQDAFRASLLLEPFEGLKSLTVYDYLKSDEGPGGSRVFRLRPGLNGLSPFLDPQLAAYAAQIDAAGFHNAMGNPAIDQYARRKLWGISNDTSLEAGGVTFRNIFGFRKVRTAGRIDSTGVGPVVLPGFLRPAFGLPASAAPLPFTLLDAQAVIDRKYVTEEFQILGTAFGDRLNWIVGGFYGNDKPNAPMGSAFAAFTPVGTAQNYTTALVENSNYALFGQVGFEITDRLTLNAGLRYSWDRVRACAGGVVPGRYGTSAECEAKAALNLPDGTGIVRARSDKPSWTIGLDYKVSDDVFTYVTSRRGYRGANVNTPAFETPFTTGGAGCGIGGAAVPCPDLRVVQSTKPEQLTDVEIGVKTNWRAGEVRGRINIAAYYSKYKSALEFANVSGSGIPSTAPDQPTNSAVGINAANETIKGVEIDATIMPTRTLTFTITGAATDSKVDKVVETPIPGLAFADVTLPTPDWSGSIAANWTLPIRPLDGELVLSADYYATTRFGGSNGTNLPGYDVANARLDWKNISGTGVDIGVYGKNLFGEDYFSSPANFSPSFPVNTAYMGEPRTYGVEATFRF